MNKSRTTTLLFTFFILAITNVSFAQSSFRIKVVDAVSGDNIEGAIVYIEEIPIPDKETDSNGFVFYQNIPEDRKVRINVRKTGYIPQQIEVVASRDIGLDNNIIIRLETESESSSIVVWGEVTDNEGNDMEGATVEINIIGKPYTTNTDESGNYQFRIDGNELQNVTQFRIEVSHPNCDKYRSDETVPNSSIINKDIALSCSGSSMPDNNSGNNSKTMPANNVATTTVGNVKFEIIEARKIGEEIVIDILLTNLNSQDTERSIICHGNASRINIDGMEYSGKKAVIGNTEKTNNLNYSLIYNVPVKGQFIFNSPGIQVSQLNLVDLNFGRIKPKFYNVPII